MHRPPPSTDRPWRCRERAQRLAAGAEGTIPFSTGRDAPPTRFRFPDFEQRHANAMTCAVPRSKPFQAMTIVSPNVAGARRRGRSAPPGGPPSNRTCFERRQCADPAALWPGRPTTVMSNTRRRRRRTRLPRARSRVPAPARGGPVGGAGVAHHLASVIQVSKLRRAWVSASWSPALVGGPVRPINHVDRDDLGERRAQAKPST